MALAAVALLTSTMAAMAQPPAECARLFVGSWTITGPFASYTAQIFADGTAKAYCPNCMPVQNWTCQGRTYILLTPFTFTQTLSPNGTTMTGGQITATRIGRAPAQDAATRGASAPPPSRRPASEDQGADICGLAFGAPKTTLCAGTNEQCRCLSVRNTCPYPVSVRFQKGASRKAGSFSLQASEFDDSSACTTRDSSESLVYLGWKPWAGFPKPGQPRPRQSPAQAY